MNCCHLRRLRRSTNPGNTGCCWTNTWDSLGKLSSVSCSSSGSGSPRTKLTDDSSMFVSGLSDKFTSSFWVCFCSSLPSKQLRGQLNSSYLFILVSWLVSDEPNPDIQRLFFQLQTQWMLIRQQYRQIILLAHSKTSKPELVSLVNELPSQNICLLSYLNYSFQFQHLNLIESVLIKKL